MCLGRDSIIFYCSQQYAQNAFKIAKYKQLRLDILPAKEPVNANLARKIQNICKYKNLDIKF
jgi:hypothetical protein